MIQEAGSTLGPETSYEGPKILQRSLAHFLSEQDGALQQMSRLLRGSYIVDELRSEAWIVACTFEAEQRKPLDLCKPGDQQLLLEELRRHMNSIRRGRFSTISIDYCGRENAGQQSLHNVLAAPADSDPLAWLQESDEVIDWRAIVQSTYTEIAAYLMLFIRFEWDRAEVARCLHVSIATVRSRLIAASNRARVQPSLFDGADHIDADFIPLVSKVPFTHPAVDEIAEQSIFSFIQSK